MIDKKNKKRMRFGLSPESFDLSNLYQPSSFPLNADLGCENKSRAILLVIRPCHRAIGRSAGVGAPRGFMACRTVSTTALGVDRGARDG